MSKLSAVPSKRDLPSKEAGLFKELLTYYETRTLKKGVKTADQILKKFPEHGETLCMKGLLLTHMGKREEGIDLVKKGVRLDLTSHICWHVFGLVQKGEKNYEEALKSYTQALKFHRENRNVLIDAANLQLHLRLFDGLVETRHTILRTHPAVRKHWVGYALAHHLNGNPLEARKILQHYQIMVKTIPAHDVEHSETLLYLVRLHEELGEFDEALKVLSMGEDSKQIVDRTAFLEARARSLSKLKSEESEAAWRVLIDYNPDCYEYYRGYLSNHGIDLDDSAETEAALKILVNFSTELPKAAAPRRLALDVASGDRFRDLVTPYIQSGIKRGIPSLFADLKALYRDQHKKQVIEEVAEAELSTHAAGQSINEDSEPTTYLWTLYYLAQHYSHLGQYSKALGLIEIALAHTPTLPELYTCKARLLKRAGDPIGAAKLLDEARLLDGQDRFLNTKCAKYMLRAGFIEQGNQILGFFTKKDASSPGSDLEDMQSLLYLEEEADAQYNAGKLHLALKKYTAIEKLFNEIEDDQYDFHGYALRRFTVNIYLNLLTWEDHLRSHPSYIRAALNASKIFVAVHDEPALAHPETTSEPLTDAEKKAKKKAKKAQKAHEEPKKFMQTTNSNEDKGLDAPQPKDEDSDGKKLLASSDPLEKAAKFLNPLVSLGTQNTDVWIATYDVAIRRKKLLQAIRALNHAKSLDTEHPELHIRIVDFALRASDLPQIPPAPIGPLFTSFHSSFFPSSAPPSGSSNPFFISKLFLETLNSQYLQKHSGSPLAILAVARVQQRLGSPIGQVEETAFLSLGNGESGRGLDGFTIKVALRFSEFLASIKSSRIGEYRSACAQRFELSTIFKPVEELNALRASTVWPSPQSAVTDAAKAGSAGGVARHIVE